MSTTFETGSAGENAAQEWLREHGFVIRDRNWRYGRYELDIVAERDGCLHIVEVKTRKADSLTLPEEAMTRRKVAAIVQAANRYIAEHGIVSEVFIDLIAVDTMPDGNQAVRFIPDASNLHW